MTAHPFGARSSLFCTKYASRKITELFGTGHYQAVPRAIKSSFYTNDCLKSFAVDFEATTFAREIKEHSGSLIMQAYQRNFQTGMPSLF